jgi:hypothetical protein
MEILLGIAISGQLSAVSQEDIIAILRRRHNIPVLRDRERKAGIQDSGLGNQNADP